MKKSVKSVISFILASVMLFSMGTSAFAADAVFFPSLEHLFPFKFYVIIILD